MNSVDVIKNICRVCLDETVAIDWNIPLQGYSDITYKECFYKYTQLNYPASDPYSSMLCQICSNNLFNIHTFILKALESDMFFQKTSQVSHLEDSVDLKDLKYVPPKFESILVEKFDDEPIAHENYNGQSTDDESNKNTMAFVTKCDSSKSVRIEKRKIKTENCIRKGKMLEKGCPSKYNNKKCLNPVKKDRKKSERNHSNHNSTNENLGFEKEIAEESKKEDNGETGRKAFERSESKVRKKYKEVKKPRMCSICSKILHNKYAVELHEKTHLDNRERNETCKICGLKFYDKRNLYSHKRIHKENREKIHKCEFCEKAFYEKGGLNIHRRIHLGQMIPCSLCSKQFYRQIDLDRHMGSHSATTISSDTKKRSRYFVRCKHCGKSILSTSFKSHTAAHLNEPLMKCSICSKEFFRRASCVLHIKKVHQKTNEEYNDFIFLYTKNRISHLFLEQKAEIRSTDE